MARNLPPRIDVDWNRLIPTHIRRRLLVATAHLALAALAYLGAFALRFDFRIPSAELQRFAETLPYLLAVRFAFSIRFRLECDYWQHVGFQELLRVTLAVTLGSLLFPLLLLLVHQLHGIPLAVFLLEGVLAVGLMSGVRLVARVIHERLRVPTRGKRTFIVGAGAAGEQLLRHIQHDASSPYNVVGLIDDDMSKHRRSLHGVPVVGSSEDLRGFVAHYRVRQILIAVPSASGERMRRLVERSVDARVDVKMLPPLRDLVSGAVQVNQVRDVEIADLLGREPVTLDLSAVEPRLAGKVVVVTGAGGSIGSELARQIMRFRPMRLILIDRAESPLHYTYVELSASKDVHVVPVLASVTNAERMQHIFDIYKPHYVFHAAAYKHVPMLEWNVVEGVWNNVFGTMRLAQCAAAAGVSTFVLISTDKAVNPASILGATKLVAERVVLDLPSLRACATDFRVVRFGNVLGSEGSVVPLFQRQLADGGPLTVTHPDARRYLMTIPEAVQLVLQASVHADAAGRIAVLEMGSQVRILDLAEQLIRLSGLVPYEDVEIKFTGMRPGEKLYEELLAEGETAFATEVEAIRLVDRDGSVPVQTELARRLRNLRNVTARRDEQAIVRALSSLAPEYTPWQPHDLMLHLNGNGNGKAHVNGSASHANGNGNGRKPVARRNGRTSRVEPTLTASGSPQHNPA